MSLVMTKKAYMVAILLAIANCVLLVVKWIQFTPTSASMVCDLNYSKHSVLFGMKLRISLNFVKIRKRNTRK